VSEKRTNRVAELVKQILSETIAREMRDPALQFVTLTKVKLTEDLKEAKIYFSKMGGPQARDEALAGLQRATSHLRGVLAQRAGLRVVPTLRFLYDDTLDYVENIERLLRQAQDRGHQP